MPATRRPAAAPVGGLFRGAYRAGPDPRGRAARRSASSPARRASAGTRSPSPGRRRMPARRRCRAASDALVGAARMIDAVNRIGLAHAALCLRHGRPCPGLAQLAQHDPGPGVLHRRLPPSRRCDAERHGPRPARRRAATIADADRPRARGRRTSGTSRRRRSSRSCVAAVRAGGRALRLSAPRHRQRRRPRRRLHGAGGADRDDLRAVRRTASATTRSRTPSPTTSPPAATSSCTRSSPTPIRGEADRRGVKHLTH